jgi:SAM-dependent methyltransferase
MQRSAAGSDTLPLTADRQHPQQMVPAALDAGLDHVRGQIVRSLIERRHLRRRRDAPPLCRQTGAEHVGHESQLRGLTDRADRPALGADVACRADQLGMRVADLVLTEPAATELVDQMTAGQSVIDHTSRATAKRTCGEPAAGACGRHAYRGYPESAGGAAGWCTLVPMTTVWFGQGVADDSEFRLCGDVHGKRTLELGVAPTPAGVPDNSITLALAGAKAIAIDPSGERLAELRRNAEAAGVRVECHEGDLADLGFATSGSIDLVVSAHTLDEEDDLPRLLRQVHRVLKPGAPLVLAIAHPVAAMFDAGSSIPVRRYGASGRTISELVMHFERTNFHIDVMHEVAPINQPDALVPAVLLVRARKQGV